MKIKIGEPHNQYDRDLEIHIDPYDVWNMDDTLAHIIHPMLVLLKSKKHGAPMVDDDDVPLELRSYNSEMAEDDHLDVNFFNRWNYLLDEMIWAFGEYKIDWQDQYITEIPATKSGTASDAESSYAFDKEGCDAHESRIIKATSMFGKYYGSLWS
jgi:hypothetical protein